MFYPGHSGFQMPKMYWEVTGSMCGWVGGVNGTTTSSSAPPLQFSGAGELFHLEQVVSLLEGFHETPTSPLAVLPSFLSSLPLSLASYFTPCLFTVVLSSFFPFFPSL